MLIIGFGLNLAGRKIARFLARVEVKVRRGGVPALRDFG